MESQRSKNDRDSGATSYDGMRSMEARMRALEIKQTDMGHDLTTLRLSMDSNTQALREYIDLSQKLKVGLSLLGVVESIAVWVTKIGAASGTVWVIWKFIILQTIAEAGKR